MANDDQQLAHVGDHVRYNTHTILGMIEGDVTHITFSDGGRVYANVAWDSPVTPSHPIELADLEVVETVEDRLIREGVFRVLTPAEVDRLNYHTLDDFGGLRIVATVRHLRTLVERLAALGVSDTYGPGPDTHRAYLYPRPDDSNDVLELARLAREWVSGHTPNGEEDA